MGTMKGEIESSTIIAKNFNTSFSIMDKTTKQKIRKLKIQKFPMGSCLRTQKWLNQKLQSHYTKTEQTYILLRAFQRSKPTRYVYICTVVDMEIYFEELVHTVAGFLQSKCRAS